MGGAATRAVREVLPPFLQMLDRYQVTATFFVVADLIPHMRHAIAADGPHEVGSHGLTHTLLTRLDQPGVVFEVAESKRLLEAAGYQVSGFRAPYFRRPPILPHLLTQAGYAYDASDGSVYPRLSRHRKTVRPGTTEMPLPQVATSTLRDGLTPFSLTYLRLYHPFGLPLVSPTASMFYCHLHEFLDATDGWQQLPAPLRRLHQRNSGSVAWDILDELLSRFGHRFVSCRNYLTAQYPDQEGDIWHSTSSLEPDQQD